MPRPNHALPMNQLGEIFILFGGYGMVCMSLVGYLIFLALLMAMASQGRNSAPIFCCMPSPCYHRHYHDDGLGFGHFNLCDLFALTTGGLIISCVAIGMALSYGMPWIAIGLAIGWGASFAFIMLGLCLCSNENMLPQRQENIVRADANLVNPPVVAAVLCNANI